MRAVRAVGFLALGAGASAACAGGSACEAEATLRRLGLTQQLEPSVDCWEKWVALSTAQRSLLHRKVLHVHIPKVAGCSIVQDLSSMVGRSNVWSHEVCYSYSEPPAHFDDTVVFVRHPRDHVISQFNFCRSFSDPDYVLTVGVLQGLPGQARYKLPETISEWLRIWTEKPRWGNYSIYEDDFFCYCPYNLQSYRMTCHSDIAVAVGCYPSVDMELALANMNAVTVLGVMEAYHESYCLLAAKLLGTLPGHCDCQDFDAWNSYSATRDDHGVQQDKGVAGLSAETLQMIDDMTQQDRLLYQASVGRFIRDLDELEMKFGTKVLCQRQREQLLANTV
ncbi:unnamed protein product [Effrenium voratum]|nr:unnamed protein product [Effrenium voratum]